MTSDENIRPDLKALNSVDPEIVLKAMRGSGMKEPDGVYAALDSLINLLDYPDHRVRQQVAQTLGRLERAEPKIIEALLEATFDRESSVKRSALASLGELSRENPAPEVIERLLELTFDKDERVRERAAFQLGNLGLRTTLIVNRVTEMLKDRDLTVRGAAIDGLGKVGNKRHIPLLKKFINAEPVYDIYDSNLVTKAKNAFEQVWDREP